MKKSNYNIIIRGEKASLIFNSFTNSYIALSNAVCDAFESLSIEDFKHKYENSYHKLCDNGVIIPKTKDELAIIRYRNKVATFGSRELRIVVYPTQDCNLKCWYCYENHVPHTRMKKDTICKIIKFVEKSINENSFDDFYITLFGGEPFIDFDTIAYPLLKHLKEVIEKAGKKFSAFFVTNASLINEDIINKLKILKPHLQITLDGNKEHHDKIRIYKDGNKPTYDHILWVIHRLSQEIEGDNFSITLRINYDNSTLDGIPEILERIKDIDRKKIFVHFERVWQTENDSTEQTRDLLRNVMKRFIKAGFCVGQGTFRGYPYSCPSDINNSIVINYDGSIHKCNGRTLSSLTKYGILNDDGSLDIDENLLAKRHSVATFENKECLNCKMLPVCMGPCSQKMLEHDGKWSKSICSLRSIDTSLNDYLVTDFWVKSMIQKYNG
ncbi:radical SAM/SPASM domain-containing protein [Bacteroides stercoris]|uniref:radical SAM/SPASM domain-containing protein n=1 Tax=Bacteroides stercoris TaxID=46506 RepID=UPI00319E1F2D